MGIDNVVRLKNKYYVSGNDSIATTVAQAAAKKWRGKIENKNKHQ